MLGGVATVLVTTLFMVIVLAIVATQWPSPAPLAVTATPGAASISLRPVEVTPQWTQVPPDPESPPAARTPAATPTPPGLTGTPWAVPPTGGFSAVAGDGCTDTAVAGSFAAFAAAAPVTNLPGGWRDANCVGTFWSVPMSGNATRDDPTVYVLWWFKVGGASQGSCAFWVYIPGGQRDIDAAGHPTLYQVTRSRTDATVIGSFTIDQLANRGAWGYGGTFTLRDGQIAVKLVNRGTGTGGARHAAAQVKIGCTSVKSS